MTTHRAENRAYLQSLRTKRGGFDRSTLATLGISWPPPAKWREKLERAPFKIDGATMDQLRRLLGANSHNPTTASQENRLPNPIAVRSSTSPNDRILIYTAASCRANPGAGGWAAEIRRPEGGVITLSGGSMRTTSNRMELLGPRTVLEWLIREKCAAATIFSDSLYVIKTFVFWVWIWEKRGWKKPRKNRDLIPEIHDMQQKLDLKWQWVRGDSGHSEHERAAALAVEARRITERRLGDGAECESPLWQAEHINTAPHP